MSISRFAGYIQSDAGRQLVAQTNNQHDAWGLAMMATKQAALAQPSQLHATVLYDNVAGVQLAIMTYRPCQSK